MLPLLLRLGGSPQVEQGGFRTPLPTWNAGAEQGVEQGGFITPLPFWNAGGGVVQIEEDITKGGFAKRKPPTKKKKELDDFLGDMTLEEVLQEAFHTGKATVRNTEISFDSVPQRPEQPISRFAPDLVDIRDEVEREIAELIRINELQEFKKAFAEYEEDVLRFEEEFIVFIMLME